MRFALVVPALNEEQAIAGTLRRCLAARRRVVAETPVTEMTIVFVNDGCTDRTQDIVDQPEFAEVVKVNYGRNRGYGAAIKAGWQATEAELVGFIDADGTCDPDFCIRLINDLIRHDADVALARRLEPNTQMPMIRKIGNRIFALLLGVVSGHSGITDTASGFRVVRRSSLKLMSPLPDGLHFTPAMSCICLLDPRLKIVETPGMHYKEREGRSKLSVVRDGVRFLYTILFSACCYSPLKTMIGVSAINAVLFAVAAYLSVLAHGSWHPATNWLITAGAVLVFLALATGAAVHELNYLLIGPRRQVGPAERALQSVMDYRRLITTGGAVFLVGVLVMLGLATVADVTTPLYAMVGLTVVTALGAAMMLGGVVVRVIWAVGEKQKALVGDEYEFKPDLATKPPGAPGSQAQPAASGAVAPTA